MLTHVVFFRMSRKPAIGSQLVTTLRAMRSQIDQLADVEVGTDVSRSPRSWDAALVTRFRSRSDLEAYRVHADHKKVLALVSEVCTETCVVDYENEG